MNDDEIRNHMKSIILSSFPNDGREAENSAAAILTNYKYCKLLKGDKDLSDQQTADLKQKFNQEWQNTNSILKHPERIKKVNELINP